MTSTADPSRLESFARTFRLVELTVATNASWIWSVRPAQPTLGACVLSLRRPCPAFGAISRREGSDLAELTATMETRLHRAFEYDRINYLMLMMVDHHVHFHVLPRYGRSVSAFDIDWIDSGWPGFPRVNEDQNTVGDAVLKALTQTLRQA